MRAGITMRALLRWSVTIPAALASLLAVSSAGIASVAVTTPPPPPTFMVTDADQGRLQAVGFTGSFTWTMCDPVADGHSCPAGTIRHFANYFNLRGALRAGQRGTFMIDLEGHGSPAYQGATNADRLKYDLHTYCPINEPCVPGSRTRCAPRPLQLTDRRLRVPRCPRRHPDARRDRRGGGQGVPGGERQHRRPVRHQPPARTRWSTRPGSPRPGSSAAPPRRSSSAGT